jgi:hypothetical protein
MLSSDTLLSIDLTFDPIGDFVCTLSRHPTNYFIGTDRRLGILGKTRCEKYDLANSKFGA